MGDYEFRYTVQWSKDLLSKAASVIGKPVRDKDGCIIGEIVDSNLETGKVTIETDMPIHELHEQVPYQLSIATEEAE